MIRLLLIEDDAERERRIQSWLPEDVRCVVARSAGAAIGTIRLDRERVYAGILLDHDLERRCATEADRRLSGSDVVNAIAEHMSRDVPILIHSVNTVMAASMETRLRHAGFDVTRIPVTSLDEGQLRRWIDDARDAWLECSEA